MMEDLHITIPENLYDSLEEHVEDDRKLERSKSEVIRFALAEYLPDYEHDGSLYD